MAKLKNVDDEMLSKRVFDSSQKNYLLRLFAQSKLLGRARMAAALSNFNVFFYWKAGNSRLYKGKTVIVP